MDSKQKLVLADRGGKGNDMLAEIGWNQNAVGKFVRFTLGDKQCIVKKDHLYTILFLLGNDDERQKVISPFIKQTVVQKYTKKIGIMATRDIRKGETINVVLEFTFNPETNTITVGKGAPGNLYRKRG